MIAGGARFLVPDMPTFNKLFSAANVHHVPSAMTATLPTMPVDGTLLAEANGAVHVVVQGARFHIPDPATFNLLYRWSDVLQLWDHAVDQIPLIPADGTLLRETNGAVHVVYGGGRFHVPDPVTLNSLFAGVPIHQLWDHSVDQVPLVPVDGTLLAEANGAVHVVYGGAHFHVPDPATFDSLFSWANVHTLWDHCIDQIPAIPRDDTCSPARPRWRGLEGDAWDADAGPTRRAGSDSSCLAGGRGPDPSGAKEGNTSLSATRLQEVGLPSGQPRQIRGYRRPSLVNAPPEVLQEGAACGSRGYFECLAECRYRGSQA